MGTNEKQYGVRLKEPALTIIEERAKEINRNNPEVKFTAGGVARFAVEQYAEILDRKLIETQLSFPFHGMYTFWHTSKEEVLEKHPFITEHDLNLDYSYDELEKLAEYFEGIFGILSKESRISEDKLNKWGNIANELRNEFNSLKSSIEEHQERVKWEEEQAKWEEHE